ncbi:MAG: YARHG domain-containing protein, partial [Deltaproteobacteria bacterium]|nr:YARHG domain-containing protein [Deltaproteobacteria bacterium]
PIVARVLRNAPFAQAGRTFSSPELTALYAADGGWYHPAGEGRSLSASDAACVAKLKRHEERLRRVVCVDPQSEAVITGHRDAWLWHHETGMTRMFGADPSAKRVIPADPGFDACAGERLPTQGEWTVARYTFALEVVATPAAAKAALSNADYGGMAPCFGNLTEAGARERFEAALSGWFRAGPVRHLRAVARIEDHLGGDEEWFEGLDDLSCVGPGPVMDRRWVCSGIALP